MDDFLKQTLLYDFYGELLTSHQKEIYEQSVLEDLSLSEIAQAAGISRQGVHDLVKRCDKTLQGYEDKLHLVEKFLAVREKVHRIDRVLDQYDPEDDSELAREIRNLLVPDIGEGRGKRTSGGDDGQVSFYGSTPDGREVFLRNGSIII